MDSGSETKSANPVSRHTAGGTTESSQPRPTSQPSRYESQKRRDFNNFLDYLKTHKTPLSLPNCSGAHVIEYLNYLDRFGKTKVHVTGCIYYGNPNPNLATECGCPIKQAWGSLDALIGRLRAAYEEKGGPPESNPFGERAVTMYLREVRKSQAEARGVAYKKKRQKQMMVSSNATEAALSLISFSSQVSGAGVAQAFGGQDRFGITVPTDTNSGGKNEVQN